MSRRRPGGTAKVTFTIEPDQALTIDSILFRTLEHVQAIDAPEVEFEGTVSAYDPGRYSGPPENCYPPEGGEPEMGDFPEEEVRCRVADYIDELRARIIEQEIAPFLKTLGDCMVERARVFHASKECETELLENFHPEDDREWGYDRDDDRD